MVEKDTNICKIGKSDNLQARIFGQGYDKNNIEGLITSGRINLEESIYINEDMEKNYMKTSSIGESSNTEKNQVEQNGLFVQIKLLK